MSAMNASRRRHRGFTLIELMITILIGLFLVGGLLSMVGVMRRTQGTQSGMAQLQDNERLAMTLITNVVESAGYWVQPQNFTSDSQFTISPPFTFLSQTIVGTGAGNSTTADSTLTVRYQTAGGDGVLDCMGAPAAAKTTYVIQFSLSALNADGVTRNLLCTLGTAAPVSLVSGITNMQILYGVQNNLALNNASADRYMDSASVPNWANVVSVKITLFFYNPLAGQPGQPPAGTPFQFTRVIKLLNKPNFVA